MTKGPPRRAHSSTCRMNAITDVYVRSHYDGMSLGRARRAHARTKLRLIFLLQPVVWIKCPRRRHDIRRVESCHALAAQDLKEGTPVKTALVNIGQIVSGDWRAPLVQGNAIVTDAGRITHVGDAASLPTGDCDVVIDADGAVVDSWPDRLPRSHYFRRLHAAAEDGRLSRKLRARRRDHGDHARPKCTCRAGRRILTASRRWRSRRRNGSRHFARAACAFTPAPSSSSRA